VFVRLSRTAREAGACLPARNATEEPFHIFRQNELRTRYPASTWVLESDSGLQVTLKTPWQPEWWRLWILNSLARGCRWAFIREGLTLLRIRCRRAA
jgi:hypothetical protein